MFVSHICPRHPWEPAPKLAGNHQTAGCYQLHRILSSPWFSPSCPHCVNCGWAEVSLSLLLSSPCQKQSDIYKPIVLARAIRVNRQNKTKIDDSAFLTVAVLAYCWCSWCVYTSATGKYLMNVYSIFNVLSVFAVPILCFFLRWFFIALLVELLTKITYSHHFPDKLLARGQQLCNPVLS